MLQNGMYKLRLILAWSNFTKDVFRSSWKVTDICFLSDFKQMWISSTDFRTKIPRMKIIENPSSGVPSCSICGDRRTDMTKPISDFREQWGGFWKTGTFRTSWMVKRSVLHIKPSLCGFFNHYVMSLRASRPKCNTQLPVLYLQNWSSRLY